MTPACPPNYQCTFTPKPPVIHHFYAHWYDGPWGIVATLVGIVALTIVLISLAYYIKEARSDRRTALLADKRAREQREQERFIAEQITMQLDAAKGDKELLKLAREGAR